MKLRKNWTGEKTQRQQFNTAFLKDPATVEQYKITLRNKFQVLQELVVEEENSTDGTQKVVKDVVTTTCKEALGPKERNHKEWISPESPKRVEERKEKKAALNNSRTRAEKLKPQAQYRKANMSVKKSIRADKINCIETLTLEAEAAARHGNWKELYATTKKFSGKTSRPERHVKDKEGKQGATL